jgi:hypothetical protein
MAGIQKWQKFEINEVKQVKNGAKIAKTEVFFDKIFYAEKVRYEAKGFFIHIKN